MLACKGGGNSNTFNKDGTGYATASAAGLTTGTNNPTGFNNKYGIWIFRNNIKRRSN